VLTEDDVVMTSMFKRRSDNARIVETYAIKYQREEIWDQRQSMILSQFGQPAPGRGIVKSRDKDSYTITAEEGGRGPGPTIPSPRSPICVRERIPSPRLGSAPARPAIKPD
jgi:hypothetical protein